MKGGNRLPLRRAVDTDLDYAQLLVETIWDMDSPHARQFRAEYLGLYFKWRRWILAVSRWWEQHHGGMQMHDMHRLDRFWDALVSRGAHVPPRRPLTVDERLTMTKREWIIEAVNHHHFRSHLSEPTTGRRSEPQFRYGTRLWDWVVEPQIAAWSGSRYRIRRGLSHRYREDIQEFCDRWGLHAWWAEPYIVHLHFFAASTGEEHRPLMFFMRNVIKVEHFRVYAPLPGVSAEKLRADIARLDDVMVEWQFENPGDIKVVAKPDKDEMRLVERQLDAGCVALDWDGDVDVEGSRPMEWFLKTVAARVGRKLTRAEEAAVRAYVDPQLTSGRQWFTQTGQYESRPFGNVTLQAEWFAKLLLDPKRRFEDYEEEDETASAPVVRNACRQFAQRANLEWPLQRRHARPRAGEVRALLST